MKKKKRVNYLGLIPERNCRWETTAEGKTCLLVPRFKKPFMKKIAAKLGKSETIRLSLDLTGTKVWALIDGTSTVEQIGKSMQKEEHEPIQQLYERLTEFFTRLWQNKFITFKNE
jgi:hypothetical protein